MVGERLSRFGSLAAVTAVSVLSGATAGCATIDVLTNPQAAATYAPEQVAAAAAARAEKKEKKKAPPADLATRVASLSAELDTLTVFDPERRAAEPALIALAAKIAAGLGETSTPAGADVLDAPAIELMKIADLSAAPAPIVPAPPETPWAVEFGQFDDADLAKTMWLDIAAAAPNAARGLVPRVLTRSDGVLLRAGPFDDREHAETACATFEAAGVTCAPTKLAGQPLIEPALAAPPSDATASGAVASGAGGR